VLQSLYRKTGSGTDCLKNAPQGELEKFFKEAAKLSPDEVKAKGEQLMRTYQISEETFAENGEYLPLSVWSARGFDIARIQQDAGDGDLRRDVHMLGDCYRVKIYSAGINGRKGVETCNADRIATKGSGLKQAVKRARAQMAADPAASAAGADGEAADEDESDSSSSSSSSSSRHKRKNKKGKKGKKDKRHKKSRKAKKAAVAEKQREAEQKKQAKEAVAAAAKHDGLLQKTKKLAEAALPKIVKTKAAVDGVKADARALSCMSGVCCARA
jgi:hypothetical protein